MAALEAAVRRPVRGPVNVAGEGSVSLSRLLRLAGRVPLPVPAPLFGAALGAGGAARPRAPPAGGGAVAAQRSDGRQHAPDGRGRVPPALDRRGGRGLRRGAARPRVSLPAHRGHRQRARTAAHEPRPRTTAQRERARRLRLDIAAERTQGGEPAEDPAAAADAVAQRDAERRPTRSARLPGAAARGDAPGQRSPGGPRARRRRVARHRRATSRAERRAGCAASTRRTSGASTRSSSRSSIRCSS